MRSSKAELQSLQADKISLELAVENTGRDAQHNLTKLQQKYQELMTEKDGLKTAYEGIHAEKYQLQSNIGELEIQRDTLEEMEKQSQMKAAEFKEQIASLAASLEEAKEQQPSIQPFKEHVLTHKEAKCIGYRCP